MRKLDRMPKTLGEKLRALRKGQAVTLDLIAKKTHIQKSFLEALERGRYADLPEPVYTRNYIRMYARALGADEKYFLELYEEENGRCDLVAPLQTPRQRIEKIRLFVWNHLLRIGAITLAMGAVIAYLSLQIAAIIKAPELILTSPAPEFSTSEAVVTVAGFVEDGADILVNGASVVISSDQQFSQQVFLEQGLNTITVEASRRYSKTATETRIVRFKPNQPVSYQH